MNTSYTKPTSFAQMQDTLSIGSVRAFKLMNDSYVIPITAEYFQYASIATPIFHSVGLMQSQTNAAELKQSDVFLTCSKDVCKWLDSLEKDIWKWAYPRLLNTVQAFVNNEKSHKRTVPVELVKMLADGALGVASHVTEVKNDKNAFFLNVLPQALVYTQQPNTFLLNGCPAIDFIKNDKNIKCGLYKAHIALRYLSLTKEKDVYKASLIMPVDQLYCITENYPCPRQPIMKTDDMFSKGDNPLATFLDQYVSVPFAAIAPSSDIPASVNNDEQAAAANSAVDTQTNKPVKQSADGGTDTELKESDVSAVAMKSKAKKDADESKPEKASNPAVDTQAIKSADAGAADTEQVKKEPDVSVKRKAKKDTGESKAKKVKVGNDPSM